MLWGTIDIVPARCATPFWTVIGEAPSSYVRSFPLAPRSPSLDQPLRASCLIAEASDATMPEVFPRGFGRRMRHSVTKGRQAKMTIGASLHLTIVPQVSRGSDRPEGPHGGPKTEGFAPPDGFGRWSADRRKGSYAKSEKSGSRGPHRGPPTFAARSPRADQVAEWRYAASRCESTWSDGGPKDHLRRSTTPTCPPKEPPGWRAAGRRVPILCPVPTIMIAGPPESRFG
jgi:hypothetical protein